MCQPFVPFLPKGCRDISCKCIKWIQMWHGAKFSESESQPGSKARIIRSAISIGKIQNFPISEWLNKDKLLSTTNSVCKIIIIWKTGLNTQTSNFFIYPLIVVMDVKRVANVLVTINCEGQQSFLKIHHRCKLRHQTKLQSICFLESFLFVAESTMHSNIQTPSISSYLYRLYVLYHLHLNSFQCWKEHWLFLGKLTQHSI